MSDCTQISPAAVAAAFGCAKGSYQRAVLNGFEAWSGSTLTAAPPATAASIGPRARNSSPASPPIPTSPSRSAWPAAGPSPSSTRDEAAAAGGAYAFIEAEAERQRIEKEQVDDEAQRLAFLQRLEDHRLDMAALAEI